MSSHRGDFRGDSSRGNANQRGGSNTRGRVLMYRGNGRGAARGGANMLANEEHRAEYGDRQLHLHPPQLQSPSKYGQPPTSSALSGSSFPSAFLASHPPPGYEDVDPHPSAFSRPPGPSAFGAASFAPAPTVQGTMQQTSAFAPALHQPPPSLAPPPPELLRQLQLQPELLAEFAQLHAPPSPPHTPSIPVSLPPSLATFPMPPIQALPPQLPLLAGPQFVNATIAQQAMVPMQLASRFVNGVVPIGAIPAHLMHAQNQAHLARMRHYESIRREHFAQRKVFVDKLGKYSSSLRRITLCNPNKKVGALIEINDGSDENAQIAVAVRELEVDFDKYDVHAAHPPISECSLPYLKKHGIEPMLTENSNFAWAAYFCALCDFHLKDIFHVEEHLGPHMKEEMRLNERRTLEERLPEMKESQLAAIERVLVETAVGEECTPDRQLKLKQTAEAAMASLRELCRRNQFDRNDKAIRVAVYGSLVSDLLTSSSDINISLTVDNEPSKFFVDGLLTQMQRDESSWSGVSIVESPMATARLEAIFDGERVNIDWHNDEGVRLSKLIAFYNRVHEDLLPLRQIVHKWAEKCDLTTPSKLASQHAVPRVLLDLMLIHALQQSGRLPVLHEVWSKAGKQVLDEVDIEGLRFEMASLSIRWNLAEVFLHFLYFFSKGDARQFIVQITSSERATKVDTKYSRKQIVVVDPFRERQVFSLHKAFQCYFINCFLTTFVNFRIPRTKAGNESTALIDIDIYQMANQSPLKKKSKRDGKKDEKKEGADENDETTDRPTEGEQSTLNMTRDEEEDEDEGLKGGVEAVVIHGKLVEEMSAEDFEVDGDNVYSRKSMNDIRNERPCKIERELHERLIEDGINSYFLKPDSDSESLQTLQTPVVVVASQSSTSTSSKKKKAKRKSKGGKKKGEKKEEEERDESTLDECLADESSVSSVSKCTVVATNVAMEHEGASTSSAAPAAAASTGERPARRNLKLIKLNSADSSDISADPSPTSEIANAFGRLSLAPSARQQEQTPSVSTESTNREEKGKEKEADCEREKRKENNEDTMEEIVLPETRSEDGKGGELQPTYEELYITLKDFDALKVAETMENLREEDYCYTFDSLALTAGFRCDLHCTACDSTKHLFDACPQLRIPPVREISRANWPSHYIDEIDRVISKIYDSEKISKSRRRNLEEVRAKLEKGIAKKIRHGFRLNAFGSSENGFGSNKSDFDVCFRFDEEYEKNHDVRANGLEQETIKAIATALNWAKFDRVMPITTAKVPIVKFTTRMSMGEIDGDISYYNELALHNTRLLSRYCSWTKDNLLAKLGMFIKRWAKQCDIGDASKGSLSSYAYIILMIHFLQRLQPAPVLPVLQEMGVKKEIKVDGWDVYFCDNEPIANWSSCNLSVGELFLQFLEYFARFDWHNQVVQVRQIRTLTKIERGWRKQMCIEDPFDLDHNLASGISNRMYAFILKSFVTSREVFFSLKERQLFVRQFSKEKEDEKEDLPIGDDYIPGYGNALLTRCRNSIGGAPRDRLCFKCGRLGHFSDVCPTQNMPYGRRQGHGGSSDRGGRGRGGGTTSNDGRGGDRRDQQMRRDMRKERLAHQRETYEATNKY